MPTLSESDDPLAPALELLRKLWALNHALERLSGEMSTKLGVTAQQRLLLRCLGVFPGLTGGALAELLHLDPGTISVALQRLEAKGLVARRVDRNDRRRVVITLTAKGRRLDRPVNGTVESAVQRVLAATNSGETEVTKQVLERLTRALEDERLR